MLSNYLTLALRNLAKHRLFTLINLLGLALGLTVFLFSTLVVRYERTHDAQFPEHERIFMIGSLLTPESGEPISEYPDIRSAYGPLLQREIPDVQVARAIHRRPIVSTEQGHYFQAIRFVDPHFTRIFQFDYIAGAPEAIDHPRGLVLTMSTALKLFGHTDVLGETVRLDHRLSLTVTAVIKDLPVNTHFNSDLRDHYELTALAPISALNALLDFPLEGQWNDEFDNNATYIKTNTNQSLDWLNTAINGVYQRHAPASEKINVSALSAHPLIEAHNQVWRSMNFPMLETVQLLGVLVLLVACVNYTNLATAQSLGRSREVGLRKVMGASRVQLITQFLTESLLLTALGMLIALAAVEILVPLFNAWTHKAITLDYSTLLPWLAVITLVVALAAGLYPAWMVSRPHPIDSLGYAPKTGAKTSRFRTFLLGAQFSISIFMLAMVLIIHAQNRNLFALSNVFPLSRILVLEQMTEAPIEARKAELHQVLTAIKGVKSMTFSNGVPFYGMGFVQMRRVHQVQPDTLRDTKEFTLDMVSVGSDFMASYDIPLLAGRTLTDDDAKLHPPEAISVVINELAAIELGFVHPKDAIGHHFFANFEKEKQAAREYRVVGLMADQYFNGTHSRLPPLAFYRDREPHPFASIRLSEEATLSTLAEIDATWNSIIKNYPIHKQYLEDYFNLFFRIPSGVALLFITFSAVALLLALTGLFGLVALLAQGRTREIGIRKVMGATTRQIVRLLVWQFSIPVIWSMLIAIPLAYWASNIYLDFFPERINTVIPLIGLAGLVVLVASWSTIALHATRVAKQAPIHALRYE